MNFSISSLSPIKVFLSTWSLWLIAFLLKPFEYTYNNFRFESATIFILLNLFFIWDVFRN